MKKGKGHVMRPDTGSDPKPKTFPRGPKETMPHLPAGKKKKKKR